MLARFSKSDFWIPGQILDLNIFFRKIKYTFSRPKKIVEKVEKIFFETKKISNFFRWKSQWKMKISKCWFFSEKTRNFEFFIFHWLFHRKKKSRFFWSRKICFRLFRQNFLISKIVILFFEKIYINPKFAQESKNHTYKIVRSFKIYQKYKNQVLLTTFREF